jgi:hypothetical protein
MFAHKVTAHEDGTLHVVGTAATGLRTGGTSKNPTYSYTTRWFMRSSSNGGASWSSEDVFAESAGADSGGPEDVTTDLAGNVYLTGYLYGSDGYRGVVRTNAGGAWTTSDDYGSEPGMSAASYSITRDASGILYVAGEHQLVDSVTKSFVRSMTSPATLMSGWTTVETFQVPQSGETSFDDIAADANGNLYAVGGAAGAGDDGASEHCAGARRRRDRVQRIETEVSR